MASFNSPHVLQILAQRSLRSCPCWLADRDRLRTVVDLAHYIVNTFALRAACPDGVALSVDGFALPPAQDIALVRDNDVVLYAGQH